MIQSFISLVTRHWISMLGSVIALTAAVLVILLFGMELSGFKGGPYLGIITYLLLPVVVVVGLVLVPVGMFRQRRSDAAEAHGEPAPHLPVIDFNAPRTPQGAAAFAVMSLAGVVVLPVGNVQGRRVHGVGGILRHGLPHGHAARIHRAPALGRTRVSPAPTATSGRAPTGS